MCGIIAFLSKNREAAQYLFNGLTILQNRGYDSAGICTINKNQEFINTKYASNGTNALETLKKNIYHHKNNTIGIAHTRWATHGSKTDYNAHPHIDCNNRISLVHNGIIENYKELKNFLIKNGMTFRSDTDSEVVANLISYYLNKYDILSSINKAINKLQGTWGIAIIDNKNPYNMYLCKKGSPLLVAYDDDFTIVASESSAFSQYTNRYIILRDNEIVKLGIEKDEQLIDYEFKTVEEVEEIKLTPDPYPHWMLKEIFEQPNTALRAISMGGRIYDNYNVKLGGLMTHKDELIGIKNLLIVASGTSLHAGMMGMKFFKYLKCFNTVSIIDASEFVASDIPEDNPGMIVLSQSGETRDVHDAMEIAKINNIIIIGVVNIVGSLISRESDCGVYLNAGREVAVASTKSFTSQVIVLALMSAWFSQQKAKEVKHKCEVIIKNIRNISLNFTDIVRNINKLISDDLVDKLKDKKSLFVLGRGFSYPIACEAALKIKEIAYIHAEGYPGGALKHGPFALLEKDMPVILYIFDDEYADKMQSAVEEVKARGAYTIVITNNKKYDRTHYDYCIQIPECGILTSLLGIMPIQYLSYKIALVNNYNPDFPKNLAKTVTTW